jgi:predicted Zn-dependent peptidase
MSERNFAFSVIGCETERPEETAAALREALAAPVPFDHEDLERVRRKQLGHYVRTFDSVQSMAFGHGEEALEGVEPFSAVARMQALRIEDVVARQREHCVEDSFATSVVAP